MQLSPLVFPFLSLNTFLSDLSARHSYVFSDQYNQLPNDCLNKTLLIFPLKKVITKP